ncbi:ATP-binding protein [Actinokineospora globicatena]|uniref:ATP-binding protein n=1 Tax=Actinokineospora globicatena TaxID=103729 RepID=UPI0020A3FBBF|nr:ATP-binding protein [Actinokineospora globicatena]MCP2303761.1 Anti-sigma regulatory factor (Ser/Thr protein kinase) [Actinokineospora globicatena]GLW86501.1 hypothetical protein Aglo02_41400 [Actinokineospora globicatena]
MSTVSLRIESTACAKAVAEIRSAIRTWLASRRIAGEAAEEILLAVSEAVTNSVEHAYPAAPPGLVIVSAEIVGADVLVVVADHGQWREPVAPEAEAVGIRGRGLTILRALTTRLRIDHGTQDSPGTTVEAHFAIPA